MKNLPDELFGPCPDGAHEWRMFDGRPAWCTRCGELGHPLAAKAALGIVAERVLAKVAQMIDREQRREQGK